MALMVPQHGPVAHIELSAGYLYPVRVIDVSTPTRSSEVGVQKPYLSQRLVGDQHAGTIHPLNLGFSLSRLEFSASNSEAAVGVALAMAVPISRHRTHTHAEEPIVAFRRYVARKMALGGSFRTESTAPH